MERKKMVASFSNREIPLRWLDDHRWKEGPAPPRGTFQHADAVDLLLISRAQSSDQEFQMP